MWCRRPEKSPPGSRCDWPIGPHLLPPGSPRVRLPRAATRRSFPADHRACPDPGSSRAESDVPAASLLFPGQSRSAVSRSRIFSGNTRRTKAKRSATANTPPLLHVGGVPADSWGKCRTTLGPPEIAVRLSSETSRHGRLREGEDRLRGSLPLSRAPPTGDTTQRKGDTAKGDTAERGYQVSLALVAPPGRGEGHRACGEHARRGRPRTGIRASAGRVHKAGRPPQGGQACEARGLCREPLLEFLERSRIIFVHDPSYYILGSLDLTGYPSYAIDDPFLRHPALTAGDGALGRPHAAHSPAKGTKSSGRTEKILRGPPPRHHNCAKHSSGPNRHLGSASPALSGMEGIYIALW
jgi:hypothetical protein